MRTKTKPATFLDRWAHTYVLRMDNGKLLDENAAALESLELIRGVRKEGRASTTLGSACAAWACRHLSQRGRLGAAKKVVEGLMAEGEAREVAGAAGVLLKLLVREGRYEEAFEVAGHFVPKQPGAGPSGLVSNDALTSLVVASGAVGGGSLALDTWHALASSAGGRGKPSEGSYRALLGACARADAQLLGSGEPILAPGTSTSRALEVGSALDYGVGSHTASVLLDSCSAAGDVSRVLELHGAQSGLGRGEGGRDLGGHGDAYGRRGFPLLVSVTSFVGGTAGLSSHLLSSLVKALFRSGRSGEAFAAVRGAAAGGSRAALAGPEPFAALVRGSAAMGAAWPMLRALELCEKHWHRPSTASAHTVLGAISRRSSPSDDPNLRRRVLDLLDPQRADRDEGYFLLDTLSYFSGNDPPSREADGAELGALEGQSPPQAGAGYFASGSHIDQTLTWRVYEKLLLTRPTRKGVRALVRRLHAAGASDFLILDRAFRALGEEPLEARRADLAAHVVAVLMHPRVEVRSAAQSFPRCLYSLF